MFDSFKSPVIFSLFLFYCCIFAIFSDHRGGVIPKFGEPVFLGMDTGCPWNKQLTIAQNVCV